MNNLITSLNKVIKYNIVKIGRAMTLLRFALLSSTHTDGSTAAE